MPIEHQVKRNLITRESMEKYVDKRMKDDKDAQRLEQSRLVLEKFGLLPPGYDLHAEFLRLLAEQVAAYYDPKTKSVNLLDWVPPDTQKPVLAHELTHALQDQKIGLEKWELAGAKDDSPLPDQQEYAVEEAQAARQCVTEGQAMVVLLDYTLAPMGKNVLTAPGDRRRHARRHGRQQGLAGLCGGAHVPAGIADDALHLRDRLCAHGARQQGQRAAYGGMLENPPVDTRQIMQPETYLSNQVVAPLTIPDLDKLVAPDYKRFDFGGMGEFDVYLLAKQYGGDNAPKELLSALARRLLLRGACQGRRQKTRLRCCTSRAGTRPRRRALLPSCTATTFPSATRRSVGSRHARRNQLALLAVTRKP